MVSRKSTTFLRKDRFHEFIENIILWYFNVVFYYYLHVKKTKGCNILNFLKQKPIAEKRLIEK